jgi:hypothetical protein
MSLRNTLRGYRGLTCRHCRHCRHSRVQPRTCLLANHPTPHELGQRLRAKRDAQGRGKARLVLAPAVSVAAPLQARGLSTVYEFERLRARERRERVRSNYEPTGRSCQRPPPLTAHVYTYLWIAPSVSSSSSRSTELHWSFVSLRSFHFSASSLSQHVRSYGARKKYDFSASSLSQHVRSYGARKKYDFSASSLSQHVRSYGARKKYARGV